MCNFGTKMCIFCLLLALKYQSCCFVAMTLAIYPTHVPMLHILPVYCYSHVVCVASTLPMHAVCYISPAIYPMSVLSKTVFFVLFSHYIHDVGIVQNSVFCTFQSLLHHMEYKMAQCNEIYARHGMVLLAIWNELYHFAIIWACRIHHTAVCRMARGM